MADDRVPVDRIVLFTLDEQTYALPIDRVQEIQQLVVPTELPDVSPALLGLINLRGTVIPAIDLRLLLGLKPAAYGLETPMVIARTGESLVALVVDQVEDVVALPEECLQSPSKVYALADRMLGVCRMGSGLAFLLDMDKLIPETQVTAMSEHVPEQKD